MDPIWTMPKYGHMIFLSDTKSFEPVEGSVLQLDLIQETERVAELATRREEIKLHRSPLFFR